MSDRSERYVTLDAEQATRVAEFINERMAEIPRMNLARLQELSDVSDATIRPLVRGVARNYWPNKLRQVAVALGWTTDSIHRVIAGDQPVLAEREPNDDERLTRVEQGLAETRSALVALADHLGIPLPSGVER